MEQEIDHNFYKSKRIFKNPKGKIKIYAAVWQFRLQLVPFVVDSNFEYLLVQITTIQIPFLSNIYSMLTQL